MKGYVFLKFQLEESDILRRSKKMSLYPKILGDQSHCFLQDHDLSDTVKASDC